VSPPGEVDYVHDLVGGLEAAQTVDEDGDEWMAAALDPDGCLDEVVLLARQSPEDNKAWR
jgi:hypothetical protein